MKQLNSSLVEIAADLTELQNFHNNTLVPLLSALPRGADDDEKPLLTASLDAAVYGLGGDHIWTDGNIALSNSTIADQGTMYLFFEGNRRATIKESFIKLSNQLDTSIASLEAQIGSVTGISSYTKAYIGSKAFDSTASSSSTSMDGRLSCAELNLTQLSKDVFGNDYVLDCDGNRDLSNSVLEMVEALLAVHGGSSYATGLISSNDITLSHTTNTSDLVYDELIPQTGVDNSVDYTILNRVGTVTTLEDDLNRLRWELARLRGGVWNTDAGVAPGYDSNIISLAAHIDSKGSAAQTAINPHGLDADDILGTYSDSGPIATVSDGTTLEAAIQALDAELNGWSLNTAYQAGSNGRISLLGGIGQVQIRDTVAGLGSSLFSVADNGGSAKVEVHIDELVTKGDVPIVLEESSGDPGATTGSVKVYSKDDSGDSELYTQDENGNVVQITRDGFVFEKLIANNTIHADQIMKPAAAAGPAPANSEYTGPPAMVWRSCLYDQTVAESGYVYSTVPMDEDDNYPSRFRVYITLKPEAPAGGTGSRWQLDASDPHASGNYDTVGDAQTANPVWVNVDSISKTGWVMGTSEDLIYTVDFGIQDLESPKMGPLLLKLTRVVGHADDDWDGDVGVVAINVCWYR